MVIPSNSDAIADLLSAADEMLEATRAAVRLAQIRSTSTRSYSVDGRFALELDGGRTLVLDPAHHELTIFPDVQAAARSRAPAPLVMREVSSALAVRALKSASEQEGRLNEADKRYLLLLMRGLPNKEIARRLGLAEATVKNRLSAIYLRFGASSRSEMVTTALALGLLADTGADFDHVTAAA